MSIKYNSIPRLKKKFDTLLKSGNEIAQILNQGGREIIDEARKLMINSPASGRKYGKHTASSAGNPPRPDTGRLLKSLQQFEYATPLSLKAVVGTGLEYAKYLEYGTSKMGERPFLRPAFNSKIDKIKKDLRKIKFK